ncbi:MAG: cyclophane-containing peptide 2OG-Fe(II) oxygenase YhhC [Bacteroidota bacterium]
MNSSVILNFSNTQAEYTPFPHFHCSSILQNGLETTLYNWFENTAQWHLTKTDFYEQYEFDFLNAELPADIKCLVDENCLATIKENIQHKLNVSAIELVGIAAHKLVDGHRIGIHNDFINDEESHRLVIHINPHWQEQNGGVLMLFNSYEASDLNKLVNPIHNSAFAFEISPNSYHAVSKIYDSSRYTIIYTFRKV